MSLQSDSRHSNSTGLPAWPLSIKMRVTGKIIVTKVKTKCVIFYIFCLGIAFNILLLCASALAITSYLNVNDQSRLKDVLLAGLNSEDAGPLAFAIRGLALLGSDIPNKDNLCKKLTAKSETQNSEALFHIGKASSILGCSVQLTSAQKEKLEGALTASSGVSELFFATGALSAFGNLLDAPKVVKALNAALKKDDSISNLGHAFQIASILEGDVSSIFGRIEDAVVQADQVLFFVLFFKNYYFDKYLIINFIV